MKEGWFNDDYWILCEDQSEAERITRQYGISQYLPGHFIVGLKGWDDFILCDNTEHYFMIPTVPLDVCQLSDFQLPSDTLRLESSPDLAGKIKWYIKPLVFGGDPESEGNMTWVDMESHQKLVRWWNQKYLELKQKV
jgi:hypothetical protein